jgi:hypothetical protein
VQEIVAVMRGWHRPDAPIQATTKLLTAAAEHGDIAALNREP